MTEYCAVIGLALCRAVKQTAVKEVTRPLPSVAERGVATRDYVRVESGPRDYTRKFFINRLIIQAVNDSTLASVSYTVFIPALTQP